MVSWGSFEREAERYEGWYATPRGQKVDLAERALLQWLLAPFPQARSLIDIGCGTGHFTRWLARKFPHVAGLDRSPAMLAEMRRGGFTIPAILGDAHRLPLRNGTVDLAVFVATLEFLEDPEKALSEAVRIARSGLVLVALNRWSVGGLSRRIGPQARGRIFSQAEDYSLRSLTEMTRRAAGNRLGRILQTSALFPDGLWKVRAPIPFGDVIGIAAYLEPPPP
jgi:ubiquinone/menaquinone biosynthesis C-methylase UbiE